MSVATAPIRAAVYGRPERWWLGKAVVTRRTITTQGGMTLPAGSKVRVTRKYSGLAIQTESCAHCGVIVRINKLSPLDLGWPGNAEPGVHD